MALSLIQPSRKHKILIVGAGFAGINAAQTLRKNQTLNPEIEILILDRKNHHLFQPLLYQVATAGLSPAEIGTPIRSIFSNDPSVKVQLADVTAIDCIHSNVISTNGNYQFDYLILSCGSQHSYFGFDEWEEFAPGLKTLEQALEIRRRIFLAFEIAERTTDETERDEALTFVVVGAGPTGVELSGAIGEISKYTLMTDFRNIKPSQTKIYLVEAGQRILPTFSEAMSRRATVDLEALGVEIRTQSRVTKINENSVESTSGVLRARTIIWAAGVTPSHLNRGLKSQLDHQGRVIVNPDLTLPHFNNIYVLGDQAHVKDQYGRPLAGLAPVAVQQGIHAAKNILRTLQQKETTPFVYKDLGQMATIGRKKALVSFNHFKFHGAMAWFIWIFVHIYSLVGFKNKLLVCFQWAWSYLTYSRGSRLILDRKWKASTKERSGD